LQKGTAEPLEVVIDQLKEASQTKKSECQEDIKAQLKEASQTNDAQTREGRQSQVGRRQPNTKCLEERKYK